MISQCSNGQQDLVETWKNMCFPCLNRQVLLRKECCVCWRDYLPVWNLDRERILPQRACTDRTIQMTNVKIITSTHTSLLSHQDLPVQARKAHLFPGLNKALLSIGTLFDHGCESTFNDKSVLILNKWSGEFILKGTREPCTNLYMLNLTQGNKLMMESTTPDEYFVDYA